MLQGVLVDHLALSINIDNC